MLASASLPRAGAASRALQLCTPSHAVHAVVELYTRSAAIRGPACAPSTSTSTSAASFLCQRQVGSQRPRSTVSCAAGKGKTGADAQQPKGRAAPAPPPTTTQPQGAKGEEGEEAGEGAEWEEGELVFEVDEDEIAAIEEDDDGEDGYFEDDEEYGEGEDGLGLEVEETTPGVNTGGQSWAEAALGAARKVLAAPSMSKLELYVFRALPGMQKLDIRLDRMDDAYGSPTIDDIEKFSRMLFLELDEAMGTELAGQISLEVSSPGADRTLRLPEDLSRFGSLPLKVEHTAGPEGAATVQVLQLASVDEATGVSKWRLADVRANAPVKGRKLSKRQLAMTFDIPLAAITRARIHVDF